MVAEINALHAASSARRSSCNTFASLWRNAFTEDLPYGDLFYAMLRDRGIHILDNFPCFLTTAHSDADVAAIVAAYKAAADEMQAGRLLPGPHDRARRRPTRTSARREAPSTEPQREVWLADKLSARGLAGLQRERLAAPARRARRRRDRDSAVRELPKRHDALRATFAADGATIRVAAARRRSRSRSSTCRR